MRRYQMVYRPKSGEWLVGSERASLVVRSRAEALEVIARAEAHRIAAGEWTLEQVHPRHVRIKREILSRIEEHNFRCSEAESALVWQHAALFLREWRAAEDLRAARLERSRL